MSIFKFCLWYLNTIVAFIFLTNLMRKRKPLGLHCSLRCFVKQVCLFQGTTEKKFKVNELQLTFLSQILCSWKQQSWQMGNVAFWLRHTIKNTRKRKWTFPRSIPLLGPIIVQEVWSSLRLWWLYAVLWLLYYSYHCRRYRNPLAMDIFTGTETNRSI